MEIQGSLSVSQNIFNGPYLEAEEFSSYSPPSEKKIRFNNMF
jgi:hypothetical protein